MIRPDVILGNVVNGTSNEKCLSWSVPGNPIGCEIPEGFKNKQMEISVTWGISPGYTVTATLEDATLENISEASVELGRFQNVQELKEAYPELFTMSGILYIM